MTQVSKYPISKDVADRIFEVFIKTLLKVKNKQEAQSLANDLFSPTEKVMLAKRLAIAFLLMKSYQYREISKLLRVSLTTIGSVNLSLNYGSNGYKTMLDRISKEERLEEFYLKMAKTLLSPMTASGRSAGWRYLLSEVREAQTKRRKPF